MTVVVRSRRPEDLPDLLVLLQAVHEQEGYPVRAAAVSAPWLAADEELHGFAAVHRPVDAGGGRRGWREAGSVRQQWGHRTVHAVLMVPR